MALLTTAHLPASFRPDPAEAAIRDAAHRAGLRLASCVHGRADCDDCLVAAVREVAQVVSPRR